MLASRVLPPIVQSSPPFSPAPVATFFNVPRRYVKSNMRVGDNAQQSTKASAMSLRNSKKSNMSHDPRAFPTSIPAELAKQEPTSSPTLSSPRITRKRAAPYSEFIDQEDAIEGGSPVDTPKSAISTDSPEHPSHVCLCQPEPKIPRPRNGESQISLFSILVSPIWQCDLAEHRNSRLCLRMHRPSPLILCSIYSLSTALPTSNHR